MLTLSLPARPVEPRPVLRISMISKDSESWVAGRLIEQVYQRAGLQAELVPLPAARAAIEVEAGRVDADLVRTQAFGQDHPQLLRVPTWLHRAYIVAAWLPQRQLGIERLQDLAPLSVGGLHGLHYLQEMTRGIRRVTLTQGPEQLCRMLSAGNVDAVIGSRFMLEQARRSLRLEPLAYSPPLRTLDLFHYLHARNRALLPAIDQALRELKASGELERMAHDYEAQAQLMSANSFP